MFKVEVEIKATEIVGAILQLVEVMRGTSNKVIKGEQKVNQQKQVVLVDEIQQNQETEIEEISYTDEEKRKVFGEYAKKNGKQAAKAILEKLGVSKVTELDDRQFAEAIKIIKGE